MVLDCGNVSECSVFGVNKSSRGLQAIGGAFRLGDGINVRFARKNSPEMLRASQRTTTTFWPERSCLATMEARRPRRWPLPSTTTCKLPISLLPIHAFLPLWFQFQADQRPSASFKRRCRFAGMQSHHGVESLSVVFSRMAATIPQVPCIPSLIPSVLDQAPVFCAAHRWKAQKRRTTRKAGLLTTDSKEDIVTEFEM